MGMHSNGTDRVRERNMDDVEWCHKVSQGSSSRCRKINLYAVVDPPHTREIFKLN